MRRRRGLHPFQLVSLAFGLAVLAGTVLLAVPVARAGPGGAPLGVAMFTAVSSVCVTGLIVVDTPTYWTGFGQTVILALIQVGGFGIMTLASLFALVFARRLGLRQQLVAQTETRAIGLGDVRRVLLAVALVSLTAEAVTAAVLTVRFAAGYGEPLGRAAWLGLFHAVSAFNNAGFALYSDNLIGFVSDPWITFTLSAAVILGGLGFPVVLELLRQARRRRWVLSLHSRVTLVVTAGLLVVGILAVLWFEWTNPRTLGPLDTPGKLLAAFFQSVAPRTAGFNSLDYGAMNETTLLTTDILMFIGGGSAGTAGGIKVTTFAVIGLMIVAEARGEPTVNVGGRRIPSSAQRQALAVAALGLGAVVSATLVLMAVGGFGLSRSLFEAASAFGTVGLSTGITAGFPPLGKVVLGLLMFLGRTGPITLAAALALRERDLLFRYPEERPIVG